LIISPRTAGGFFFPKTPKITLKSYFRLNRIAVFFKYKTFYKNDLNSFFIGGVMNTNTANIEVLSRKKAAAFLGVCLTTLDRLDIPRTRVRHRVLYRRDVLDRWVVEQTESRKKGKA
jgi:hypothetical protein